MNRRVQEDLPWNVDGDIETAEVLSEESKGFLQRIQGLFVVSEDKYVEEHSQELVDIREKYRAELENDQLLILLNEEAHRAGENETELDKERAPLSAAVPTDYELNGYTSDPAQDAEAE